MIWKRPKYFVLRVLSLISLLSLFVSSVGVVTMLVWNYYPSAISAADAYFLKNYLDDYDRSLSYAKKLRSNKKLEEAKYELLNLHEKTKNLTKVDRLHQFSRQVKLELISLLIKMNDYDLASALTHSWREESEKDIDLLLLNIDVLKMKNENQKRILSVFSELNHKFYNVKKISLAYSSYLKDIGEAVKADEIISKYEVKESEGLPDYLWFKFYYLKEDGGSYDEVNTISVREYGSDNGSYLVKIKLPYKYLNSLRMDIEGMFRSLEMSNVRVELISGQYKKSFKPNITEVSNEIYKISSERYLVSKNDPYISFEIDSEELAFSDGIDVAVSFDLLKGIEVEDLERIYNSHEWQFFYSDGWSFNGRQSKNFSLDRKTNMTNDLVIEESHVNYVRVDFPSILNLTFNNVIISIQNSSGSMTLDAANISNLRFHGIKKDKGRFVITGTDPYVVMPLDNHIDISKIKIKIAL